MREALASVPGEELGLLAEQIPWQDEAMDAQKLGYILNQYGLFHTGHRASDDCHALLHILAAPLKVSGKPALAALLENARQSTIRLWAKDAPFARKDILRREATAGRRIGWITEGVVHRPAGDHRTRRGGDS
jgi:DNA polymerase-3 subunit epsilon